MKLQEILVLPPELAMEHLLGATLIATIDGVTTGGIISELEAYLGADDAAAHGSRGETKANTSLYKNAGTLYLHSMRQWLLMDIVTEDVGVPSSVLVRGLIPTIGVEYMSKRRNELKLQKLANGPGKVCQALGITKELNGENILKKESLIQVLPLKKPLDSAQILYTKRIGISKNTAPLLRVLMEYNEYEYGN